nr:hypothetical protein [Tanacetum cinerariifolium]
MKNLMDEHKVIVDVKKHGSEPAMESVSILNKRHFSCRSTELNFYKQVETKDVAQKTIKELNQPFLKQNLVTGILKRNMYRDSTADGGKANYIVIDKHDANE